MTNITHAGLTLESVNYQIFTHGNSRIGSVLKCRSNVKFKRLSVYLCNKSLAECTSFALISPELEAKQPTVTSSVRDLEQTALLLLV